MTRYLGTIIINRSNLVCRNWQLFLFPMMLWEIVVGKSCGKFLWENLAGNSCGKILWEKEKGKKNNLRKAVIGANLAFGIG